MHNSKKYLTYGLSGSLGIAFLVILICIIRRYLQGNQGLVQVNVQSLPDTIVHYKSVADTIDNMFSGFNENEQGIYDILVEYNNEEIKAIWNEFGERYFWFSFTWAKLDLRECVEMWFDEPLKSDTLELIDNALNS